MTNSEPHYHIGLVGEPWGAAERTQWLNEQTVKRSYKEHVLSKLDVLAKRLKPGFDLRQYGHLSYDSDRYPLLALVTKINRAKPTALITGGVHGYETSGVQGAIRFLETQAEGYAEQFNLVVAPCISPWAYETINRWNPNADDPNRSFVPTSEVEEEVEESAALMSLVASLNTELLVHIDLHETTDTDNSEFRPALSARDNVYHEFWEIPDGFYLVGDTENPCDDFQASIIDAVSNVTHIAPSDAGGRIIGERTAQAGVINYATKQLGLCTGFTDATFSTTTEVYPDSPMVDDENCILAQVAAVTAALDFAIDASSQVNKPL